MVSLVSCMYRKPRAFWIFPCVPDVMIRTSDILCTGDCLCQCYRLFVGLNILSHSTLWSSIGVCYACVLCRSATDHLYSRSCNFHSRHFPVLHFQQTQTSVVQYSVICRHAYMSSQAVTNVFVCLNLMPCRRCTVHFNSNYYCFFLINYVCI